MTLTEYYEYNNKRALHDAEIDFRMHRLIANIMHGGMRYVNGDMQVYRDEEWVPIRSMMRETPWSNTKLN